MQFRTRAQALALLASSLLLSSAAQADGQETLGPLEGVEIANGTGVLLAGTGLFAQPGSILINVDEDVTIEQVFLYWEGTALSEEEQGATDTILVNGQPLTGDRIGGATSYKSPYWISTYRVDVTGLGLLANGPNEVVVDGLDFTYANNGAGLAVIVDDGASDVSLELRDGSDFAYYAFKAPFDQTELQTFTFEPADVERVADLGMFFGSVSSARPSAIGVLVDGEFSSSLVDVLGNTAGPEWDTVNHQVVVPAGATSIGVQVFSTDLGTGQYAGNNPASVAWVFASLTINNPSFSTGTEGCEPVFWKHRWWKWDGWGCNDVTQDIHWYLSFNGIMGTTWHESRMCGHRSLYRALCGWGVPSSHRALNRHADLQREELVDLVLVEAHL